MFSIYVQGDCSPFGMTAWAQVNGKNVEDIQNIEAFYGEDVVLGINGEGNYGSYQWDNGTTGQTRTIRAIRDREVYGVYITQGGRRQLATFKIHVTSLKPCIVVNGMEYEDTLSVVVHKGDNVVLSPKFAASFTNVRYNWSNGSEEQSLAFDDIQESQEQTFTFSSDETSFQQTYNIYVLDEENGYDLEDGKYLIVKRETGEVMTWNDSQFEFSSPEYDTDGNYAGNQVFEVSKSNSTMPYKYKFYLASEEKYLNLAGKL